MLYKWKLEQQSTVNKYKRQFLRVSLSERIKNIAIILLSSAIALQYSDIFMCFALVMTGMTPVQDILTEKFSWSSYFVWLLVLHQSN